MAIINKHITFKNYSYNNTKLKLRLLYYNNYMLVRRAMMLLQQEFEKALDTITDECGPMVSSILYIYIPPPIHV